MEQANIRNLVELLSETYTNSQQLFTRCHQPILKKQQVTPADKKILYGLHQQQKITKTDLAKKIALQHSSLTRSLERLEVRGLLKRNTAVRDKRFIELALTPKGNKKVASLKVEQIDLMHDLLQDTTPKQAKIFHEVLEQIGKRMQLKLTKEQTRSRSD